MNDPTVVPDETNGAAWRAVTAADVTLMMREALGPHVAGRPTPEDVASYLRTLETERLVTDLFDRATGLLSAVADPTEADLEQRALAIYRAWLCWHLDHTLIPRVLR